MIKRPEINEFYREKLKDFGASAKGMGWKDDTSQLVRFEQILKIVRPDENFSLNDLGCGSGDIIHLLDSEFEGRYSYTGYDALPEMVSAARKQFGGHPDVSFREISDYKEMSTADYSIASGIFNVRNDIGDEEWRAYILQTLKAMSASSRKGFAFNALTSYSDAHLMRRELYYSPDCH